MPITAQLLHLLFRYVLMILITTQLFYRFQVLFLAKLQLNITALLSIVNQLALSLENLLLTLTSKFLDIMILLGGLVAWIQKGKGVIQPQCSPLNRGSWCTLAILKG